MSSTSQSIFDIDITNVKAGDTSSSGVTFRLLLKNIDSNLEDTFLNHIINSCGTITDFKRPIPPVAVATFVSPDGLLRGLRVLSTISTIQCSPDPACHPHLTMHIHRQSQDIPQHLSGLQLWAHTPPKEVQSDLTLTQELTGLMETRLDYHGKGLGLDGKPKVDLDDDLFDGTLTKVTTLSPAQMEDVKQQVAQFRVQRRKLDAQDSQAHLTRMQQLRKRAEERQKQLEERLKEQDRKRITPQTEHDPPKGAIPLNLQEENVDEESSDLQ